jgi:HK97 family phage portal protein
MGLMSWVRRSLSLTDHQGWSLHGGQNWAGKTVTHDGALNLSAWFRGVRLYADVTGALPLKFYERRGNDDRIQNRDHPVAIITGQDPNDEQTTQEFWGAQAAALTISGNAFAEKKFIGDRLISLQPMPRDTSVSRVNGGLVYKFDDRGKTQELPTAKVFHTRGFHLGGDVGLSPLAYARQSLSAALATEEATGKTFAQGMRASGFFTGPKLTPEQRADFKKTFIDPIVGNNAEAHYGILENGFDFKQVNMSPKDAEMLLSRRFNIEELARYLGVPPILLGHAQDGMTAWGSGVENIMLSWLTLGLNSFLTNIEKSVNKRLLRPEERIKYYAEFDRNALLQADSQARGEFISKMIQNAQMTPNEGRKKDNRSPMPGGDQLLINSTLIPLTSAGASRSLATTTQTTPGPTP